MTPYRRAAELSPAEVEDTSDLAKISAAGRDGADAEHGRRGQDGDGSGEDGGHGGHAGPAADGDAAGTIEAELTSAGQESRHGAALLRATVTLNGRSRSVEKDLDFSRLGSVVLRAIGGDGGDGGNGGRGGDGARGRSGSDATRYSSGGSGGSGGDGGRGGDGSSGGRGGLGGSIIVNVDARDTHLLMLVAPSVEGGSGGRSGENGRGGAGGAGGRGGSSYSWTESESYVDSQGQSQTRTTHHSNPGGSSGSSGRDGQSGNGSVKGGIDGDAGRFEIRVREDGRTVSFPARYDLALLDVSHDNENQDGIYEPGEKASIPALRIANTGSMPLPEHHPIVVELAKNEWIVPVTAAFELPRKLAPGESIEVPCPIDLTIKPHQVSHAGEAFAAEGKLELAARLPAVNRGFDAFTASCPAERTTFAIGFPLQLGAIASLHTLAVGEAARVSFWITNISKRAFGTRSSLGRAVGYRSQLHNSEVGASAVVFKDARGEQQSLEGQGSGGGAAGVVERLEPGQSMEVAGTLAVAEGAEPYAAIRLRVALELGRIESPEDLQIIHIRDFVIRVAERYRPNPRAGALLVVQNRTTRAEIDAWRGAASGMGLELATWDVTLEGHLDLEAEVTGGPLARQFEGKLLILLNDAFDGELAGFPFDLLDSEAGLRFCAAGGRIVVLGERVIRTEWTLLPRAAREVAPTAALARLDEDRAAETFAPLLPTRGSNEVSFKRKYLFGGPTAADVERAAKRTAWVLDATLVNRRHVVIHSFDGDTAERGALLTTKILGKVAIHRTLDVGTRGVMWLRASVRELHDPLEIEEKLAPLALGFGSSAKERTHYLGKARPVEAAAGPLAFLDQKTLGARMRQAIVWELTSELLSARSRPVLAPAPPADPKTDDPALPAASALTGLEAGALLEMLAVLRVTAWGFVRWWHLLPPLVLVCWFLRPMVLHRRVKRVARRLFDEAYPDTDSGAKERRSLAKQTLRDAEKHLTTVAAGLLDEPPQARAVKSLRQPILDAGLAIAEAPTSLVLAEDDLREFHEARTRQARRRKKLTDTLAAERKRKLSSSEVGA